MKATTPRTAVAESEGLPTARTAVRVSIVGAGSAVFSLQLVRDLCSTPSLAGSEIVLMDIDMDRLESVTKLARRCATELDADVRFEQTTDREAALRDVQFVVNIAYASGHQQGMRLRDTTTRHGYYHSSVGIYGPVDLWAFNDLRLRLDFARDMERLCPDAWLLQSGNPVFEGCTLMARETGVKIIGLCDGIQHYRDICEVLEIDPARVIWEAPGLNHQIWLTRFLHEGRDAYPLIEAWIDARAEEFWRIHRQNNPHDISMSRGAINLYHMYGLMPVGDTSRDPINWWLHTDPDTKRYWFGEPWGGPDTDLGRSRFIDNLEDRLRTIAQTAADPSERVTDLLATTPSFEMHVPIIDALAGNRSGVYQVNVRNDGALADIADDVVVELPAHVDHTGVHPLSVTPLPRKIMLQQILPRVLQMEQMLQAFKTGDRSMLFWSALMDPQTRSHEQAVAVLDALLEMDGHEAMAAHHEWPLRRPEKGRLG